MKYFLLIIFIAFNVTSAAVTYYVSPSGNNINTGSINSPFKSISFGISRLKAGDILYVRSGVYAERIFMSGINGTESNSIQILAYPGESPVIDGNGINLVSGGALVNISSNYITLDGFEVKASSASGITTSGSSKNILIRRCNVHDCWEGGIGISSSYSVIEYCNVYNVSLKNSGGGTSSWSAGLSARRYPDYCILRHNVIHDSWGEGLSTFEATHTVIEDNTVYDSYSVHIYVSDATDCLVQRNLIYRTKSMGVGRMEGLVLADEKHSPESARNIVINNIVYGCQPNFRSGNSTPLVDCLIANNTFVNAIGVTNDFNVQIGSTIHLRSRFENNLIIQENSLPCIFSTAGTGLIYRTNLYNKSYDPDAIGTDDVVGDPKFNKTGNTGAGKLAGEYFTLSGSSPAIDKGTPINEVTDDFLHYSRGTHSDIGALEHYDSDPSIQITELHITAQKGSPTVPVGANLQLNAEVLPSNASNKNVDWSITNVSGQAIINSSGLVTAIKGGTVITTATAQDGSGVSGTLEITILSISGGMNHMVIYPNPAGNYFNIYLQNEVPLPMLMIISNLSGTIILQNSIYSKTKVVDISSSFVNGIYLVQLWSERVNYCTEKLIVYR